MTFLAVVIATQAVRAAEPFAIEVVDDATGRGVPLVELTTTGGISYVTDSAGLIAFDEPELLGQRVHFAVKSHGYEFRKDGFGIAGIALDTKPGGSAQLKIRRLNIAERLYRITGQGVYRDSVLLGREPPLQKPLLNARVIGSDSVMNAVYRGRIHWFWGDTNQVKYPLGLFDTPGATSRLLADGGLDPGRGVDLEYYVGDDGFARATAPMPGEGPTWISGVSVLPDAEGRERMFCGYVKIKPPMEVYRRGIAVWNDEKNVFDHVADFEPNVPLYPDGHPFVHQSEIRGECIYFAAPFPLVRALATAEAYQDLAQYEAFTCLKDGSSRDKPEIDRSEQGVVRYQWRAGTPPVGPGEQAKLIKAGLLLPHEGLLQLRDARSGKAVTPHAGSVYWNEYRRRFVLIDCELYGTSLLGETWYAEADSPLGPWVYATKIITHDKYSFYNPKQHPFFDQKDGRLIYFEGTYTHTFSGNEHRTPRYDYNQIMYRLDLADERLALPVAVYDRAHGFQDQGRADQLGWRFVECAERANFRMIAFFALDRPRPGAIAIYRTSHDGQAALTPNQPPATSEGPVEPLFWAMPAEQESPQSVPLFEYANDAGSRIYDAQGDLKIEGFRRADKPLCRVWPSPYRAPSVK